MSNPMDSLVIVLEDLHSSYNYFKYKDELSFKDFCLIYFEFV